MNGKLNFVHCFNYFDPLNICFKGESKFIFDNNLIAPMTHQCPKFIIILHFSMVSIGQTFSIYWYRFQSIMIIL